MDYLSTVVTLGVAFLGYIAIEVRGLRRDFTKMGQRVAHVEGVLEISNEH